MTLNQLALPPISGKYRALLDSDILLELLNNRSPFVEEAEHLFEQLREDNSVELYITDRALRRIVCEHRNLQHALKVADYFQKSFEQNIIQVSEFIKTQAREVKFPDFESAIEHVCAEEYELDAIITQNPSNYPNASIAIWSVSKLEERVVLEKQLATPLKNSLLHEHLLAEQKNGCSISEPIDSNISIKDSNSDSQPDYLLEKRLADVEEKLQKLMVVEEKLQQMFVDQEDRRRRIETLITERSNVVEGSQDADTSNSVGVSLEDLCSLLKPASQFIEVE